MQYEYFAYFGMFCVFPVYVDCSNSFSYGVGFSKYASFDKTANVGSKNADFWNREEVSSVCCLYWNESSRNVLCSGLGSLTTVLGYSVIFCFSICGRKTSLYLQSVKYLVVDRLCCQQFKRPPTLCYPVHVWLLS